MSNVILTFIYDRRKRANSHKEGSVELRITMYKTQKYLTTGIRVLPKYWKHGQVVGVPDATEQNETLENLMRRVRKAVNELEEAGELDIDTLINELKTKPKNKKCFMDYIEERAKVRMFGLAKGTQKRYKVFIDFMKEWGGIISFGQITERNIMAMDDELKLRGLKETSRWNYHKFMKFFIADARIDGYITAQVDPYARLKIRRGRSEGLQRCLSESEFKTIENMEIKSRCMSRVRDLFVFQTYTMMSYSDLAVFNASSCQILDGETIYQSTRVKTGVGFVFVLLEPAKKILRKYNNNLPIISDQKYNSHLKVLAQLAGIDKPITSHWARHTGATLLLNKGVRLEVVSKILGHSNTKITEGVYAKLQAKTIAEQMAAIKI